MIDLKEDKNYYILIDKQGGRFGGNRILESIEEVAEQFEDWADSDEIELKGMTIADCLETWQMGLKKYNEKDFVELSQYDKDLDFIIN